MDTNNELNVYLDPTWPERVTAKRKSWYSTMRSTPQKFFSMALAWHTKLDYRDLGKVGRQDYRLRLVNACYNGESVTFIQIPDGVRRESIQAFYHQLFVRGETISANDALSTFVRQLIRSAKARYNPSKSILFQAARLRWAATPLIEGLTQLKVNADPSSILLRVEENFLYVQYRFKPDVEFSVRPQTLDALFYSHWGRSMHEAEEKACG
jgi:hypothetical protein